MNKEKENKKSRKKEIIIVSIILLSIFLVSLLSIDRTSFSSYEIDRFSYGQISLFGQYGKGNLTIQSLGKEWNVLKSTGTESNLIFWTANAKEKKTEIGWIPKDNNCLGLTDKNLRDENDNIILDDKSKEIILKCESSKCDGKNCYYISLANAQAININEYVKLGENSIITAYQDINMLNYNLEWTEVNISLFKNISDTWNNTVNDIWVYSQGDSEKFGANDSQNDNVSEYKYKVTSLIPIYQNNWQPYIKNPEIKYMGRLPRYSYYQTHVFDFSDICSREFEVGEINVSANCQFDYYNEIVEVNETYNYTMYFLEVMFISDKDIDPTITIDSIDGASTSLLTNVTAEVGDAGFTHLEIDNLTAPYDSLIGYWNFDGDNVNSPLNTSYDWMNDNDGTMVGDAVVNSTGAISDYGNALQLDGVGDYVQLGDNANFKTQSKTIAMWIKRKEYQTANIFNGLWHGGTNYYIQLRSNGALYVSWENSIGSQKIFVEAINPALDEWMHIAVTFDVSGSDVNVSLYTNGYFDDNSANSEGHGTSWDVPYKIGSDTSSANFNGSIDEVMFFNTALTGEQITEIYNNQSDRFHGTGLQEFNNQTQLNISSGYNRVNVSTKMLNDSGSNINLSVGYYNGSWFITDPQTISDFTNYTFNISGVSTNLTLNYTFLAGNNTDPFYSPIINGDIILDTFNVSEAVPPSDDPPVSILSMPLDGNITLPGVIEFECNATDDSQLLNVTLHIWNATGNASIATNTTTWNGTTNTTKFNHTLTDEDWYVWNCLVYDNASQGDWADANFTLNITTPVSPDNEYPVFSSYSEDPSEPTNYAYEQDYEFNVTLLSTNGSVQLEFESVNYTALNFSGVIFNYTFPLLGAGNYSYHWNAWGNGTDNNYNNSNTFYYNVTPAVPLGNLTNSTNLSVMYPTEITTGLEESNNGDSDLTYIVHRDNVSISTGETITLGAGTYIYLLNTTGGNNWTANASMDNFTHVVSQNDSLCDVEFNETSPLTFPQNFTAFTNCTSSYVFTLNSTVIVNGSSHLLGAGTWNFTVTRNDDANYSNILDQEDFVIDQATPTLTKLLNGVDNNLSISYPQQVNATGHTTGGTLVISRNGVDVTSENSTNVTLGVGIYYYDFNVTGNQNYSSINATLNLTITSGTSLVNLTIDDDEANKTIAVGTAINLNCTIVNGDPGGYVRMEQEGTIINNGTSPIGNLTTFDTVQEENITCYYEGTGNYTISSQTWFVNVTDDVNPNVTIDEPSNQSYTINNISFNVTVLDSTPIDTCLYTLNNGITNYTMSNHTATMWNATNTTMAQGSHTVIYYCNDTSNNLNNTENVTFFIDSIYPEISIIFPTNASNFSYSLIDINYTFTEDNPESCWWSNNSGSTNYTFDNCTTNITDLGWNESNPDNYTLINLWINDTVGNTNSTSVSFKVDTIYPSIIIGDPANASVTNVAAQDFQITGAYDFGFLENITLWIWKSDNSLEYTYTMGGIHQDSQGGHFSHTFNTDDVYHWNYHVCDELNHCNWSTFVGNKTVTIDLNPPYFDELPQNQTLPYLTALSYNINATDPITFDNFAVNDTRFAINESGNLINATTLGVLEYFINITINDSANNLNSTIMLVNVTQLNSVLNLSLNYTNGNVTINQGDTIDLNCSQTTGDPNWNIELHQEETTINNGSSPLGNATTFNTVQEENITCIYRDSQNYTISSQTWYVNVTDTGNPNVTIDEPQNSTFTTNTIEFNVTVLDTTPIDTCLYTLNNGITNYTMSNHTATMWNATNTSMAQGGHEVFYYCNDTNNNLNNTESVSFYIDSIIPLLTIVYPTNTTYSTNVSELNYTFTESNPSRCWYSNDSGVTNFTDVECGTNFTEVTSIEGSNTWTLYMNDTAGNENHTSITFFKDTTPPNCVLISQTPSDLLENSTGIFEVIINCTDNNELNVSRILLARTVGDTGKISPPFNWSFRPPSNNKGSLNGVYPEESILLADGRGDNKWFDDYTTPSGSLLFADNFSYSVQDNSSYHIEIINGSYSEGHWALLNYTWNVEPSAQEQMVFLSRGNLEREMKKNYSIYNNNPLLVKFWNFHFGYGNYTTTSFLNIDYIGNPNKNFNIYFCNSSYDPDGSTSPSEFGNPNCVYANSFTETIIDLPRDYTSKNSSYLKTTYGITNNMIGGVIATNYIYIFFQSDTSSIDKTYQIRYVNGSSGTNVSFNDSKVAWSSTNEGVTWTQAEFTPDIWISQSHDGSHFLGGPYVEDIYGNNYTNFTLLHDDIGMVNHPISSPTILFYNSTANIMDLNLNETHTKTMQIKIGISIDPDSVGNVSHNLTLHNIDGTLNYSINMSFFSADDSDVHVYFDTTNVVDGIYRMNVTATAGDNLNDIESFMQENNFTIDNTDPLITIDVPANDTYGNFTVGLNVSASEEIDTWWYSLDYGATNETFTPNISIIGVEGGNYLLVYANDTAGNQNVSNVSFTIDTGAPSISITYPIQSTNYSINVSLLNYTATEGGNPLESCWYSRDNGVTNSTPPVASGTNFTKVTSTEGSNTWAVYCNDTLNTVANDSVSFWKDTIYPGINITSPLNNTNNTDNGLEVNYTITELNPGTCWWTNDTGAMNNTITCGNNITGQLWPEGETILTAYINDTSGNLNSSSITFNIDSINPFINITTPLNGTVTGDVGIDINYSISDTNLETCWYTNDTGVSNYTIASCANLTGFTWDEGENIVRIYANDTFGNVNSSSVNFTVDTGAPIVSITFPTNTTYAVDVTALNYTATNGGSAIDSCWYSLDLGANNSSRQDVGVNWTGLSSDQGSNNWTVYCNDSVNNVGLDSVTFFKDTITPNISIVFPTNYYNTTDTGLEINYTFSNINDDTCWWTEDIGVTNTTLASCGTNVTGETWDEGLNTITIYINDTGNNQNSSSVTFTLDTQPPHFFGILNQTIDNETALNYNIPATDTGVGIESYSINWTDTFNINISSGLLTNTTQLNVTDYIINVTANDTLGNQNSTLLKITITEVIGDDARNILEVVNDVTNRVVSYVDNYGNFFLLGNITKNMPQGSNIQCVIESEGNCLWGFNSTCSFQYSPDESNVTSICNT